MSAVSEDKMVFAVAPEGQGDGVPLILMGIPSGAWEHMRDGKTHTFDLTKAGLSAKLMLFGAQDHDAAMRVLQDAMKVIGTPYLDERRTDFSIAPKDSSDA